MTSLILLTALVSVADFRESKGKERGQVREQRREQSVFKGTIPSYCSPQLTPKTDPDKNRKVENTAKLTL